MAEPPDTLSPDATADGPDLLSTKLHVPRLSAGFVPRPRLLERLDEGLARGVTLVCAPAGFGKSALLADWCRRSRRAVAWLSIDAGDNDPVRFWRHAAAALDQALDGPHWPVVEVVERLVRRPEEFSHEAVVTAVINVLAASPGDVVLVLDDYHVAEQEEVHASVRFLLEHAPPGLRVVLVSRADPPLLLARWRARGELTELRVAELRFTAEEAAAMLREAIGSDLPDDAAATLAARTEGWAAGLQLAGLSLQGHPDVVSFVEAFSGSHRFVLDYLTEEVLDRQPATIRDFLLETSILDRLSAPLADAVTGRTDGQEMLESIERANLFLIPLDDVRCWWRYHHLFSDLLRIRLEQQSPEEVRELHRRAATWHDENRQADQAVRHALSADDPALAAEVIERHAAELLLRSEGATWGWLAEVTPELLGARRLLLARARLALYGGRVAEAEHLLDSEPSVDRPDAAPADSFDLNATLLRAFAAHLRGDADRAETLASLTLDAAGDEQATLGLVAQLHLAVAPWLRGAVADAELALTAGIDRWRAAHDDDRAAWTVQYLGEIQRARGHLDDALETYREVLTHEATHPLPDALATGVAHVGIAEVAYQRNDLDTAQRHATDGVARCRQFVYSQALATGLATLACVHQAEGDHATARDVITEAVQVGPSPDVVDLLNPIPATRARLLLAQGDVDAAAAWVATRGVAADDEPRHVHEPALLVLARVLLTQDRAGEALRLLERLRTAATRDCRFGRLIEIDVLRALVLAVDDEASALGALAAAVALAAPERHIRVFIDEGQTVGRLLGQLDAAPDAYSLPRSFLGELVRAFDHDAGLRPGVAAQQGLIVPLTDRELDVIRLIATGKRNQEIATELYVSLNTVKKHVTHIFDKLGVANRTAATARARELDLLS